MYPPREPNVRKNTDQFTGQEFGSVPQSTPSISFKSSRKPLAGSANRNMERAQVSGRSGRSTELPPLSLSLSREFEELNPQVHPTSGTEDDDDDRDDEQDGENEIPIREVDETTETPEEFEVDDED